MSVVRRAVPVAKRSGELFVNLLRGLLRLLGVLIFLAVALVLPLPFLRGPTRYEHAGRQNEPTEVERRR